MRVAIGLRLEGNEDWEQAATYVTEAERLGVDFAWSHESWGMDAATPLAFMAARTSRIRRLRRPWRAVRRDRDRGSG